MRLILLIFLSYPAISFTQTIERTMMYSSHVKDSFVIKIRKPASFSDKKTYHLIYVADGSLKLGSYVLGTGEDWKATIPENCIIITFAHTGDWHDKRPRDFIPSDAGGYKDKNFGQANLFYWFLKSELIPLINKKFVSRKSTAMIGHSFSGLFCLYTLFQEDKLFDRHFAISPSVWANYGELLKIESNYFKTHKSLSANVSLQAGGLEVFNKVLSSTRQFYSTTLSRHYSGYIVTISTVNNANHISMIKPGVDKVLLNFKD